MMEMDFVKRKTSVMPKYFELSEVTFPVLVFAILVEWNWNRTSLFTPPRNDQRGHALILVQQSSWEHACLYLNKLTVRGRHVEQASALMSSKFMYAGWCSTLPGSWWWIMHQTNLGPRSKWSQNMMMMESGPLIWSLAYPSSSFYQDLS